MKVAIIDDIAAHYRLLLFQKLSLQKDPEYFLFASERSHNGVSIIDTEFAELPAVKGGINWTFIKNIVAFKIIFWQKGVFKIAARGDFDVYIFPGEFQILSTWLAIAICKIRNKKVVFWGHGSYGNEKNIKKYLRQLFNKLPDAYLLYNKRAKDLLIQQGINGEKLFLINNSLNYDTHVKIRESITQDSMNSIRKNLSFKNKELPLVLFIGRFTKEKKIEQLIRGIDILNKRDENVNCVLIGDGEQKDFLENLVINLNLENNISFYGPSYNEGVNGLLLSIADCCVSPGNVGLNAIHSMTFGTPVITHNDSSSQGPEVSSVIENFTGELFEKNNLDDLVDKIQKIVFVKGKKHYRNNCLKIVDDSYNPTYQVKVFNKLIQYLTVKETS